MQVCGVQVGRRIRPPEEETMPPRDAGSIMMVMATDAPLSERQLHRLCVRAAAGLARTGSQYGHGSGDFVIAFSSGWPVEHEPAARTAAQMVVVDEERVLGWLFRAVVEGVEEAILNSLFCAETVVGRDRHVRHALPVAEVVEMVRRYRPDLL